MILLNVFLSCIVNFGSNLYSSECFSLHSRKRLQVSNNVFSDFFCSNNCCLLSFGYFLGSPNAVIIEVFLTNDNCCRVLLDLMLYPESIQNVQ